MNGRVYEGSPVDGTVRFVEGRPTIPTGNPSPPIRTPTALVARALSSVTVVFPTGADDLDVLPSFDPSPATVPPSDRSIDGHHGSTTATLTSLVARWNR